MCDVSLQIPHFQLTQLKLFHPHKPNYNQIILQICCTQCD